MGATVSRELPPEEIRRRLSRPLLNRVYRDVYRRIVEALPSPRASVLEIGSGGGFFADVFPGAITSDCVPLPGVARVVDACALDASFEAGALDAIVAVNVFHHLPDVEAFLRGACRALRPGGRLVLVEPWFTPFASLFYRYVHHEPVVDDPNDWTLRGKGRLDGANERLPTSVFKDGTARLRRCVPDLELVEVTPFNKWSFLLSGGLRFSLPLPDGLARWVVASDRDASPMDAWLGLFARIVLEKRR